MTMIYRISFVMVLMICAAATFTYGASAHCDFNGDGYDIPQLGPK